MWVEEQFETCFLLLRILVMSKWEYSTNLISSALSSWVMCFFKDTLLIVAPPVALWEICICAFIYILFGTVQYLLLRKSFSKIIYTYIFGNEIYHPAREEMFISPWEVHFGYFDLFCLGNSLKVQVCVYHLSREPWFYFFYFFYLCLIDFGPFPFSTVRWIKDESKRRMVDVSAPTSMKNAANCET